MPAIRRLSHALLQSGGRAALLASVLLPVAGRAPAQDAILLEEIVVSAGRTAAEADRTGATVTVLDGTAIAETAQPALARAVDTLPGVSVSQSGGPGAATSLRVRGFPARYAPTYLDGIRLTDPSATQQDLNFGALPTLGLARIEVLKGAASAVYGSEAVAGVVTLSTGEPEAGQRLRVAAELGSFDTARGSLGLSSRGDRGWLRLDAGRVATAGISAAEEADGNTERDAFRATSLLASGRLDIAQGAALGFSAFRIDSETDQDGFDFLLGGPADDAGRENARRTGLRLFAEVATGDWTHAVAASTARTERDYPTGFTRAFDGERRALSWQATRPLGTGQGTLGLERAEESFRADAVAGAYDIASAVGELRLPLGPRADLMLSLRADDHSAFGSEITGRAALAVRPDANTVLRASAGTGYRAPSLYELYVPVYGNALLAPETSRSLDFGIERRAGPLTVSATAFWVEIEDLIGFTTSYAQVAGRSTSRGLELAAAYAFAGGLEAFGNYTLTDAEDADGAALLRVPRHDLTLGLRGRLAPRLTGAATLRHTAGLTDTDGGFPAQRVPLADHTVADLALAWEVSEGVEVYGRVENLTDVDYQTVRGYGTPGRAVYAGLRASF